MNFYTIEILLFQKVKDCAEKRECMRLQTHVAYLFLDPITDFHCNISPFKFLPSSIFFSN